MIKVNLTIDGKYDIILDRNVSVLVTPNIKREENSLNKQEMNQLLSKEFLTVPEVQAALGLAAQTVIRKINDGILEGVDLAPGKSRANWRIRSSSVKELLGIQEPIA
jgi:Helix-turn-helix domain